MKKYIILILILFIIQFPVFHTFWLKLIGRFLIYQDKIEPVDAILVLGGGSGERVYEGVHLYRKKYADKIMFTGEYAKVLYAERYNWAIQAKKLAVNFGVPENRMRTILNSQSTHDDAVLSKEVCLKNNYKSIIVVTEPYHTRRAYYTFKKVYKNSGIKVFVYPVQDSWYRYDNWWQSEEAIMDTNSEYIKFVFYLLKRYI